MTENNRRIMPAKATTSTKKASTATKSAGKPKFSKETYIKWYKDMLLIRRFEEKTGQLYIQQKFGGFCHLYIGQEAIVAGTASACRPGDKHMTAYRDHAHPIALGTDPRVLMAELYGRTTGCSKGKGGSMHFFDKEKNLLVRQLMNFLLNSNLSNFHTLCHWLQKLAYQHKFLKMAFLSEFL